MSNQNNKKYKLSKIDGSDQPVMIVVGDSAAIPRKNDPGLVTAWRLSLALCLIMGSFLIFRDYISQTLLEILPVTLPDTMPALAAKLKSWAEMDNHYRGTMIFIVPEGILMTIKVTCSGILVALCLGLITGLGRISKIWILHIIASTYVEIVRGIPLLVQIFYIYFGVTTFIKLPPMISCVMALGICYGAYMGEVFRAGIESVDKGQREAAVSLGFSNFQTMRYVVLPQALRTILPPVGNEFISMLKDSSLVAMVSLGDILRISREYAGYHFSYFESYTMVAMTYLTITLFLSKLISILEREMGRDRR